MLCLQFPPSFSSCKTEISVHQWKWGMPRLQKNAFRGFKFFFSHFKCSLAQIPKQQRGACTTPNIYTCPIGREKRNALLHTSKSIRKDPTMPGGGDGVSLVTLVARSAGNTCSGRASGRRSRCAPTRPAPPASIPTPSLDGFRNNYGRASIVVADVVQWLCLTESRSYVLMHGSCSTLERHHHGLR